MLAHRVPIGRCVPPYILYASGFALLFCLGSEVELSRSQEAQDEIIIYISNKPTPKARVHESVLKLYKCGQWP